MKYIRTILRASIALLLISIVAQHAQAQTVRYVDQSAAGGGDGTAWSSAYIHLQDALDEANLNGGTEYEIRVAEGVYYPDDDSLEQVPDGIGGDGTEQGDHVADDSTEVFTIARDSLVLRGGYAAGGGERDVNAHATVLSGDITQDDAVNADGVTATAADQSGSNSFHVVSVGTSGGSLTSATQLDGLTITAGHADGSSYDDQIGGGVFNDGSNPVLVQVVFSGNSADGGGGGMFNEAGYNESASPTLINVTFAGNEARGGGGLSNSSDVGGGESSPTLVNVVFTGNSASGSGGALSNSGVNDGESSPRLVNVTFSGNTAQGRFRDNGGAMFSTASSGGTSEPQLVNCIFWGDSAGTEGDEIYNQDDASATLSHSIIEGGVNGSGVGGNANTDGGGNLDRDPLFADASSGDLRLQPSSPAIDAGDNSALPPDSLDLDGDGNTNEALPVDRAGADRTQAVNESDAVVDMGAYESDGSPVPVEPIPGDPPETFVLEGNAPNPVAGATTIRYALPQAANVTLTVYDVLGRRVRTLVSGEKQTAGRKRIRFAAGGLSAGVYVVRMQAGSFTETRRMVVVE